MGLCGRSGNKHNIISNWLSLGIVMHSMITYFSISEIVGDCPEMFEQFNDIERNFFVASFPL